ncbi:head-tail adaptor protein [Sedimentitalea sp. JM2-8]|uniref:Head-tail adaptor protein n=1 Tax=Sedimentitalea xiamensis TaxID=3050037 RepID=A0ABT7FD10_9RHOB|nr:head-tail adaptor protein [Sedimentitalea xiamensis]MDK3072945.1 head-tail adaptor protein [Sedimentitalea xiamensis]
MNGPHLNRLLSLEAPIRIADGAGGYVETWAVLGEHWAEVRSRTGRERDEAGVPISTVSYNIVVRSAPFGSTARPMPQQRFRDGQRLFVIQAVAERDREGRFLTCFADEELVA